MTCEHAEQLVMPYINDELTDQELEEFLEHINTCENCREELEIYFTVDVGIRQLESGTGAYDIRGALETALESSKQRVKNARQRQILRYAVNTLYILSLFVVIMLQCRIWFWGPQAIFK